MLLMNKNIPVLYFDMEDKTVEILNNEMLPFCMINHIKNTSKIKTLSEGINNYDEIRHFFAGRTLSLSRDNAKQILQSIQGKQRLTEEESYQLSIRCRGVSVSDNFWVKKDDEGISFEDINIRENPLTQTAFQICIKGTPISLQHELLAADLSTNGMFRKTWQREGGHLWLYKSDKTANYLNTKAELEVSRLLDDSNIAHISYTAETKEDVFCCKCKCFTNNSISFVDAEQIEQYCVHHGETLLEWIKKQGWEQQFANMVVIDYLFLNPDEHRNNWGFLVDSNQNRILGLAPLFDNNQALLALYFKKEKEFGELIYDPTGKTILESAIEWLPKSNVTFIRMPSWLEKRYEELKSLSKSKEPSVISEELDRKQEYGD